MSGSTTVSATGPGFGSQPLGERHRLLVWLGETAEVWKLPPSGNLLIGRGANADLRIDFVTISRQHARMVIEPGVVRLSDLGSQNGTRVNGERVTSERQLQYGDIIGFGDTIAVFLEDSGASAGPLREMPERSTLPPEPTEEQSFQIGDRTVLVADPAMKHVYTQLGRLAQSDLSVLLRGETGTGKEVAAGALHAWSRRAKEPFIAINCAALPESIAESELFGHTRGAFSGATADRAGLIEAASGGTIFLDEIGDLSLPVQGKLLRVLETRRLTRLGSVQERPVDIRVVAATHRDLGVGVKEGWFRQDLFFRLNVAMVVLPPLRMRRRDIPLLANSFLQAACEHVGRPPLVMSDLAMERLQAYSFPGNVRELKNLMDYLAAAVPENVVTPEHLRDRLEGTSDYEHTAPIDQLNGPMGGSLGGAVAPATGGVGALQALVESTREHERKQIQAALAATGGNKTKAAKLLGVPLRTFMEKIKRLGLG
ncbi:MAG TPA: sigma 54-interacting transcriptional regulator [Polyangia bacterium]